MNLATLKKSIQLGIFLLVFLLYSASLVVIGNRFAKKNVDAEPREEKQLNAIYRPSPEENIQSAEVLASNVKLCANTQNAFELIYPNDWFTTYNNKDEECSFFAPYSFVVPSYHDDNFTPLTVNKILPEEWESTVQALENPNDLYSVISLKNLELSGRPVKYIESISTGNVQPKGYYKITYLVFDTKMPFEFVYQQQSQDEDVEKYKQVLADMVASLRLF